MTGGPEKAKPRFVIARESRLHSFDFRCRPHFLAIVPRLAHLWWRFQSPAIAFAVKKRRPRPAKKKKAKATKWTKAEEAGYQYFLANSGIRELGKRIREIQKEVVAQGLAPHHRDLLKCPQCGLYEDALFDETLIVPPEPGSHEDTGLRFEKIRKGVFRCPSCGARVKEPKWEPPADWLK
jgi:predicted RNA-binding Zn-ribbon protein involved in translation (DUF1610 family)